MTNSNLEKGIPWRFGPDWPGQRCGAKTRKGTPCQRAAKLPVGRCRLHGGDPQGPKDGGWPGASYSGSYDPWEVHKGEACGRKALCRTGPADASRAGRA
jgi:hypothetical protein